MTFLLHRDTCEAWVRGVRAVRGHALRNQGNLNISAVTVMELGLYVLRAGRRFQLQLGYFALKQQVAVIAVDDRLAEQAALVGSGLPAGAPRLSRLALIVVATALEHGTTLVTHNVQRYAHIPGLTVVDWMVP
jgi:predicted nucleic acid-binding protein